jgi:hypothetical protein
MDARSLEARRARRQITRGINEYWPTGRFARNEGSFVSS